MAAQRQAAQRRRRWTEPGGAAEAAQTKAAMDLAGPFEEPCGAGAAGDGRGKCSPRRSTALKKMQPEAPLEIELLRQKELEDMVVQGREDTQTIILEAGFFGGTGWSRVVLYASGAILTFVDFIYWAAVVPRTSATHPSTVAQILQRAMTLLLSLSGAVALSSAATFTAREETAKLALTGLFMTMWSLTQFWVGCEYIFSGNRKRGRAQ